MYKKYTYLVLISLISISLVAGNIFLNTWLKHNYLWIFNHVFGFLNFVLLMVPVICMGCLMPIFYLRTRYKSLRDSLQAGSSLLAGIFIGVRPFWKIGNMVMPSFVVYPIWICLCTLTTLIVMGVFFGCIYYLSVWTGFNQA